MSRSGRYRGRRRLARLLGFVGIFLVIASVLSVTGFLFLRDYVTRTDDGLLLSFPFLDRFSGNSSPIQPTPEPDDNTNEENIDLIVEPLPTPTPAPTPEVVEVSAPVTVSPAFLAQKDINSPARLDELVSLSEAGDIDTIIIEVKSTSGVIIMSDTLLGAAERLKNNAKLIAYFSVLEDNTITRQRTAFGIKHISGVNWLDINQSRWINPYIPEAREWLAAQLSAVDPEIFSAILIDNLWFPPAGRLEVMVLDDDPTREEILEILKAELIQSTTLPCWLIDSSTGEITYQGDAYAEFPTGAFN
jgi:hypothetical protein